MPKVVRKYIEASQLGTFQNYENKYYSGFRDEKTLQVVQ